MTLSERSLSWLTDTVLPCGFVGPLCWAPQASRGSQGIVPEEKHKSEDLFGTGHHKRLCNGTVWAQPPGSFRVHGFSRGLSPISPWAALRSPLSQRPQVQNLQLRPAMVRHL